MSGPKLMQVTTSPLAILINEAVFMAVGKVAYFSPKIEGVNKDIENEIEWFENYGFGETKVECWKDNQWVRI